MQFSKFFVRKSLKTLETAKKKFAKIWRAKKNRRDFRDRCLGLWPAHRYCVVFRALCKDRSDVFSSASASRASCERDARDGRPVVQPADSRQRRGGPNLRPRARGFRLSLSGKAIRLRLAGRKPSYGVHGHRRRRAAAGN